MSIQQHKAWSRREFLGGLALASGAGLLGVQSGANATEAPPEITTIRLVFHPETTGLCYAPLYVAQQFLRLEGFTDVHYLPYQPPSFLETETLADDHADITAAIATDWVDAADRGLPVVVLAGLHAGCVQIFGSDGVHTIRELKGKRVGVDQLGGPGHRFLSSVVAYIGLDPNRDIEWVVVHPKNWADMLAAGEVNAIHTFPPMGYEIQARGIGHVILNTTTDEPWRHYFCCMLGARREFVQNYPVATKRALRALLKANQICTLEPERTARWLADNGVVAGFDYALQTLQEVKYGAWRDYDPEDTLRFFSLRLREVGMIKHNPQQIIDQGTDWRFINELKRELKA